MGIDKASFLFILCTEACHSSLESYVFFFLKVKISCAILSKYTCNTSLEVPAGEVRVIMCKQFLDQNIQTDV